MYPPDPPVLQEVTELTTLTELAQEASGARFRLADLQLHTPVDRNFRPGRHVDTPKQRADFAERYVAAALKRNLEVVAITEHNDVSWIDEIRDAAGNKLLIFPGFEVASAEGVHVLCLFEPDAATSRLDELLVELGLPSEQRWHPDGAPRMSKLSLQDLVAFIHERDGLCILSHVDREDGVLHRLSGEPRVRAWLESGALVVQCSRNPRQMEDGFVKRTLLNEEGNYNRERPYACIQTSDARTLAEIGSKATYIKMSSESIEGLRQAFYDPDSRTRFPDEHELKPYPKILAAEWDGTFIDAAIPFNANLNCLIGGKGTAKSTVIETLRHAFGLPIASQAVAEQAEALLAEVFPASGKLSLLVEVPEPQPTRYIVERTGRERPIVRDADTGSIIAGLEPLGLFQPVIFGQKEIYETALRMESQLDLLDRFCGDDLTALRQQEKQLMRTVAQKSTEARQVHEELAGLEDRVSELPVVREKKRLFDQAGLAGKLEEQKQLERERSFLDAAWQRLDEHQAVLHDIVDAAAKVALPPKVRGTPNADIVTAASDLLGRMNSSWEQAASEVAGEITRSRVELGELRRTWQERFETRRAEFDAAVADVAGAHGESNIRDYLQLDAKIDRLTMLEEQADSRRQTLDTLHAERHELVTQLREARRQIFLVRERQARQLTTRLSGAVSVTVTHQGNREQFLKELRNLRSGAGSRQLEQLVNRDDFSPARFAQLGRSGAEALVSDFGVSEGTAQQITKVLTDERVDRLEILALEDRVEISLNVGADGRAEFRPLDRLSAGQRSTAILLLALLESDGPLVLDQPEDDLDNRFIYEDVVRRLREAKERRQFIIATHNANIPVLGDAEQIIILDATVVGDRMVARAAARGSIDDAELHGPLEDVLEGGREAFERRKEKYGF